MTRVINFEELKTGDKFYAYGVQFIAIDRVERFGCIYNAVRLDNGELRDFYLNAEVKVEN